MLNISDQYDQIEMMIEACEGELARLVDLRGHHSEAPGLLVEWLDHDIGQVEDRLEWLRSLQTSLVSE